MKEMAVILIAILVIYVILGAAIQKAKGEASLGKTDKKDVS